MKRVSIRGWTLGLALIGMSGFAGNVFAATLTASSCAQAAVQSAINSAAAGDTVVVPNGSCTWTSSITISGKGIHLKGATAGGVIITHSAGTADLVNITPDATRSVEISNLRFMPGAVSNPAFYMSVNGVGKPVLVHDLYMQIQNFGVSCIHWGARGGVLWKNEFEALDKDGAGSGCIPIKAESAAFDTSWLTPSTFGTADVNGDQNVYFEDNTFRKIINQVLDPDGNARIVVRHNTFDNSGMASHGADTGPDGMRHAEIYENTFVFSTSGSGYNFPLPLNWWIYIRGGSWVIADNVMPDLNSQMWGNKGEIVTTVQNVRRRAGPYPCWTTYPAPRQFGEGFLGLNLGLEPSYIWNNTGSPSVTVSDYSPDECGNNISTANFIKANRDYYLSAKPGYQKYKYPHPLRNSGPVPSAPSNLKVN